MIEVTAITIHKVSQESGKQMPVLAEVRIILGNCFVVTNISIIRGKFGLFVSFPRKYDTKENKGFNICYPITKAYQDYLSQKILEEYRANFGTESAS